MEPFVSVPIESFLVNLHIDMYMGQDVYSFG